MAYILTLVNINLLEQLGFPRGVCCRQHIVRPGPPFPVGDRRLAVCSGHEARALHDLHPVHISWAVGQDVCDTDPYHELGLGVDVEERVVLRDRGNAAHPQTLRAREVDEQDPELRVLEQVPHRQVHPVAVVARERERPLVDHANESRLASFVRALWQPVLVRRREEEHVARLDERAIVGVERLAVDALLDPVGEPPGVELVLERAVSLVVEIGH